MALQHSAKGSVNYTVVGSPTITDGVASGFGTNDYLQLDQTLDVAQMTECVFKIHIPSSALGQNRYMNVCFGAFHLVTFSHASTFNYTGFNLNGLGDLHINQNLAPDTNYWVKYTNDGTNCTAWWSDDGISYTQGQSKPTSSLQENVYIVRIGGRSDEARIFDGSIDLNETYIKVNGQPWFGVCPVEVQQHQVRGPVGYTVVGSPTIADGVVSGFTKSDYVVTDATCDQRNITEFAVKIKVPRSFMNTSVWNGILYQNFSLNCFSNNANYFIVNLNINGISALSFSNLLPDVWCWLKYTNDGKTGRSYYSYDGENYTKVSEVDTSDISQQASESVKFGLRFGASPFQGQIDFNETYVKVNGKLWFWQPRETERIVVNGVEVWRKA